VISDGGALSHTAYDGWGADGGALSHTAYDGRHVGTMAVAVLRGSSKGREALSDACRHNTSSVTRTRCGRIGAISRGHNTELAMC
jgi:hypothetical protein